MFKQMLLQLAVAALQQAVKNDTFNKLLTQFLGGLTGNPGAVQQLQAGNQTPPEFTLEGETLKIKHADGQVHDVDLSVL